MINDDQSVNTVTSFNCNTTCKNICNYICFEDSLPTMTNFGRNVLGLHNELLVNVNVTFLWLQIAFTSL